MLIISGEPSQERRTNNNKKMSQAEEKAGRCIWRNEPAYSWGAIPTWHQNIARMLKYNCK